MHRVGIGGELRNVPHARLGLDDRNRPAIVCNVGGTYVKTLQQDDMVELPGAEDHDL